MRRLLFVDDEPRILQGIQRQLRPMRDEWEMKFAESGHQALDFMANCPVDVVISDMTMPGMDGAELLTEVKKRFPDTVRLVLSGHAVREAVFRLVGPAHQYLSKPCNPEELRTAIARALAVRSILSNEKLTQLVCRIDCLPSLPTLYTRLLAELHKDEPCLDEVAKIVSKDVGMTAKILQMVNSAFFGLPQPAANVKDALTYLGLGTLQALVLSIQVFSEFDLDVVREFAIDDLEDRSWLSGVLARRIAQAEGGNTTLQDYCFLGSMLHDLGCLALANGLRQEYRSVINEAKASGQPIWQVEQARLGATHAEVGGYLLGLWGLPTPVIEAVALHHRPSAGSAGLQPGFSVTLIIHAAILLANQLSAQTGEINDSLIDLEALRHLGCLEQFKRWSELCRKEAL